MPLSSYVISKIQYSYTCFLQVSWEVVSLLMAKCKPLKKCCLLAPPALRCPPKLTGEKLKENLPVLRPACPHTDFSGSQSEDEAWFVHAKKNKKWKEAY